MWSGVKDLHPQNNCNSMGNTGVDSERQYIIYPYHIHSLRDSMTMFMFMLMLMLMLMTIKHPSIPFVLPVPSTTLSSFVRLGSAKVVILNNDNDNDNDTNTDIMEKKITTKEQSNSNNNKDNDGATTTSVLLSIIVDLKCKYGLSGIIVFVICHHQHSNSNSYYHKSS